MFVNGGVSINHPFMLGESYNQLNSSLVFGNTLNSSNSGSKITLVIPSDFNGTMFFFCTAHSGMQQQLLIDDPITNTAPHSLAAISSLSIFENQPVATLVGSLTLQIRMPMQLLLTIWSTERDHQIMTYFLWIPMAVFTPQMFLITKTIIQPFSYG